MPAYTIIKNNQLGRVIRCTADVISNQLAQGESYLNGAYPKSDFNLVDGLPVEITQSERDVLIAQRNEATLRPDRHLKKFAKEAKAAGLPTAINLPATQDWTKADAHNAIDQAAGRARFRVMSPGTLLSEEYKLTQAQVNAWRSAGSLANAVPATLQSWVTATGMTAEEAAQDIEQTAAQYEGLLELIRDTRLIGKANVNNEQTDYISIALAVIAQLDRL